MQVRHKPHTFLWFDIGYAAEMEECGQSRVNFIVFRIVDRVDNLPLYQFDGGHLDSVTGDIDKAVPFFEGSMEIDGCVNAEFNQEPMLVHFCNLEQVIRFNAMTVRLYETAAELLRGQRA
jgi:hypothetical protein